VTLTDLLAVWGAGLSTLLAAYEVWKYRRSTRAMLVGYLERDAANSPIQAVIGDKVITKELSEVGHGQTRRLILHNVGGAPTEIHKIGLCIARPWIPRMTLGLLGTWGFVPAADAVALQTPQYVGPEGTGIDPGADKSFRVVIWDEHRVAFSRGRLLLSTSHRWCRHRPQQVLLRPML
jgi:hypothetical protein